MDGFTYLEAPPGADGEAPAKPWVRMNAGGTVPGHFGAGELGMLLGMLERPGVRAEVLGSEDVRGIPTQRAHVTVPPAVVPKQVVAMEEVEPEPIVFDLWVDDEHRLRRLQDDRTHDGVPFELELFDFGMAVTVEAPPADQVDVSRSEPTGLTGGWELVATGPASDLTWTVQRAPIEGGECFKVEIDEPSGWRAVPGGSSGGCRSSASGTLRRAGRPI